MHRLAFRDGPLLLVHGATLPRVVRSPVPYTTPARPLTLIMLLCASACVLLLCVNVSATASALSAPLCADAQARQVAMRAIVLSAPQQGFSVIEAQRALELLDIEWKRAFGDTASQPRYQEAVEDYATRAMLLVSLALRPQEDKDVAIEALESARREEASAYSRLQDQARLVCPAAQDQRPEAAVTPPDALQTFPRKL